MAGRLNRLDPEMLHEALTWCYKVCFDWFWKDLSTGPGSTQLGQKHNGKIPKNGFGRSVLFNC